jgi:hypothetical protein
MTKEAFTELLQFASTVARKFANRFVHITLPETYRYFVHLNHSFDGNLLRPDQQVFPEDTAKFGECIGPLTASAVVDLLWRDGLLPEWVDISPLRADAEHTYFQLVCCGRFTADDSRLYYSSREWGPFGIKSPSFPPSWSEEQRRFDFHSCIHQ